MYIKCKFSSKISGIGVQRWDQLVPKFKIRHMEYFEMSRNRCGACTFFLCHSCGTDINPSSLSTISCSAEREKLVVWPERMYKSHENGAVCSIPFS